MRPRVFPAEDVGGVAGNAGQRGASMRPRVFPAEDTEIRLSRPWRLEASMRPRVFPAEDVRDPLRGSLTHRRFNEAAGIPRGRIHRMFRGVPVRAEWPVLQRIA